jgi:Mor family transcriptional regulator
VDSLTVAIRASLTSPEVAKQLPGTPGLIESLAKTLTANIRRHIGGEKYVAKRCSRAEVQVRNERMRAEFTGNNYDQLAHQYDMSTRQVRRSLTRRK